MTRPNPAHARDMRPKTANIAGLQLADIVEEKFRCSRTGQAEGYGLVVLPK